MQTFRRTRASTAETSSAALRTDPVLRRARLLPALVAGIEDLRHEEVVRVDLQAELRPLALREAHVLRRLPPAELVVERGARLRDVGQMARIVDLGLEMLRVLDDVALLVVVRPEADDRAQEHVGVGQVVHDGEQALADLRGKRDRGAVVDRVLELSLRDQTWRTGADAFLHGPRRVDEGEREVVAV